MNHTEVVGKDLEQAAQKAGDLFKQRKETCWFCEIRGCEVVGAFVPNDQAAFGALEGKKRAIFYPMCLTCIQTKSQTVIIPKVEKRIFKEFGVPYQGLRLVKGDK